MRVWTAPIAATTLLVRSVVFQAAEAQNTDPASVLKRYVEALNASDVDTASALWAEDGVITNTRGRRYVGRESLRPFIQGNIARNIRQEPEAMQPICRAGEGTDSEGAWHGSVWKSIVREDRPFHRESRYAELAAASDARMRARLSAPLGQQTNP